jgi:hypothetical protein
MEAVAVVASARDRRVSWKGNGKADQREYQFGNSLPHGLRKSPSLHGQKSAPTPKFLGMAEAYFVCPIDPNFQISLIYAFIRCP